MISTGTASISFGYPWWLTYGHLTILAVALAVLALAYKLGWPKWLSILSGVISLWALAAFLIACTNLNVNSLAPLPTENFLRSGTGRVIDLGAGTGRSSIMVLAARPQVSLVALDLFEQSFDQHFGHSEDPQERLRNNLKIAGVDQRASIQKGDVRKLPFEDASFDGAVSAFVIDHLSRDGSKQALAETARVLKPGGEFLLILINNDVWVKFTFGPMLIHTARRPAWWSDRVKEAGFQIVEEGTPPAMWYVVAKR